MPILIAIVSGVGVLLLGYYFMGRIDNFLAENVQAEESFFSNRADIVLFVDECCATCFVNVFARKGLDYEAIHEPHISPGTHCKAVFAFSSSDLDNLIICNNAQHYAPGCFMAAKCNDRIYYELFRKAGITAVVVCEITEQTVEDILEGWSRSEK